MKYYVVSESELKQLVADAWDARDPYYGSEGFLMKTEAACRAREVKPLKLYDPRTGHTILGYEVIEK